MRWYSRKIEKLYMEPIFSEMCEGTPINFTNYRSGNNNIDTLPCNMNNLEENSIYIGTDVIMTRKKLQRMKNSNFVPAVYKILIIIYAYEKLEIEIFILFDVFKNCLYNSIVETKTGYVEYFGCTWVGASHLLVRTKTINFHFFPNI